MESRIFDGWLTRYKINRKLSQYEVEERLEVAAPIILPPVDKGVVNLNSVFIEYIDRHFFLRGWAAMWCSFVGIICMCFAILFGLTIYTPTSAGHAPPVEQIYSGWFAAIVFVFLVFVLGVLSARTDFFCYTYYPIRFNRKTRKVYIFRNNGPSGVMEMDWEEAYWFIGRTRDGSNVTYDVRCHLLDEDGIVRHTFAVGYLSESRAEALQHWEMIRRYMQESPAELPFPPLHLFVCTKPTLWNAFVIQLGIVNATKSPLLAVLGGVWACFRWASQKTCKTPSWPDDIEAVCQIPADDPYRLPEPWRAGQVRGMSEEDERKSVEYTQQATSAAQAYES